MAETPYFHADPDRLCGNCLEPGADRVTVGPEQGTQRDPEHAEVPLCLPCFQALLRGDFSTLHARHTTERIIRRTTDGLGRRT